MGQEADPVKLNICSGWEGAEGHEREDEENYPCEDIKEHHYDTNQSQKILVKLLPSGAIQLAAEYCEEPDGDHRNGHT